MSFNPERYYRARMSSSCSLKSEDSDDYDLDDAGSWTNSSSNFSQINSIASSSNYSLNDKRRSRNQNEKKRRDQFNLLIQELGNLLNHPRKIDKATVLNETLFFFRNYNDKPLYNKEIDFKYKPFFLQNDEFMRFMIEFQNAFCLVFDLEGRIKYVSDDIMHLMGHYPKNLQNCLLYDYIDDKSVKQVKAYLENRKFSPQDTISFECNFRKINGSNGSHEPVKIKGFFKRTMESNGHFNTIAKLDAFMHINELYPRDNNKREFTAEFSMDFKYTSLDTKATEIVGYSPIEILGTCGYDYCHHDDLEKLVDCHKKLLQNGAVPLIAYRFRTKGLQWLWVQSRFQILNHHITMKPYAIQANNHVVGLNEMMESKDILENSELRRFYSPSASKDSDCSIIEIKPDNHEDIKNTNKQWPQMNPNQNKTQIQMFSPDINQQRNIVIDTKMSQSIHESDSYQQQQQHQQNQQQQQQKQYNSTQTQSQTSSFSNTRQSYNSNPLPQSSRETKSDKQIDDSLGSIFLRSYTDIEYRNYVLSQFKMKKQKIESTIRKHQEELKILEETMENISDGNKLASWVMEFQKQESNTNKQKPPTQRQKVTTNNPAKYLVTEPNPQQTSPNQYQQIQSSHMQQQQQQQQMMSHGQSLLMQAQYQIQDQNNQKSPYNNNNNNSNNKMMSPTNKTNLMTQKSNPERNYIKSEYCDNNDDNASVQSYRSQKSTKSLNETNRAAKRGYSESPRPASAEPNTEESELVGQLITLQNILPNSIASTRNLNNNQNMNSRNSNQVLQSLDMEDLNSEMIDKLFNNYTFDSFTSQ